MGRSSHVHGNVPSAPDRLEFREPVLRPSEIPASGDTSVVARIHELRVHLARLEGERHQRDVELLELVSVLTAGEDPDTEPGHAVIDDLGSISVKELASSLRVSVPRTYRLLAGGAIPGAFKVYPERRSSHWFVPVDAEERFRGRGTKSAGT